MSNPSVWTQKNPHTLQYKGFFVLIKSATMPKQLSLNMSLAFKCMVHVLNKTPKYCLFKIHFQIFLRFSENYFYIYLTNSNSKQIKI